MFHLRSFILWSAICIASVAHAETFYAASVRTHGNLGADALPGTLYTIDPATAQATVVAPIRLGGVEPIGIVGLAVQPGTGVFYGITGRNSPTAPHSLVKVDPGTGIATLVGPLRAVGSDIGFSPNGTLYTWLPELKQLGIIDPVTGNATPIGSPSSDDAAPSGALAITSNETGYVAATGATGTLDRLDLKSGARTRGPVLTGAPYPNAITNLSFSPWGKLFAVNANAAAPADTVLVTVEPETGAVSVVGQLPTDIEALIFAPGRPNQRSAPRDWSWLSASLAVLALVIIFAVVTILSRRASR